MMLFVALEADRGVTKNTSTADVEVERLNAIKWLQSRLALTELIWTTSLFC